jgi:PAS domain S-box-containing protein
MSKYRKKDKDHDFDRYFLFSSIPNVKAGLLTTIIILAVSTLVHKFLFPGSMINQYLDQFSILLPFIILTLIVVYFKVFHKWLFLILVAINTISAIAIYYIGSVSGIDHPGYQYFLPWTMLMMMGTFIFYRVPFIYLMITSLLMILGYILALMVNHTLRDQPEIFLSNIVFIISMASLGYFIIKHRSTITKQLYLSERELRKTNECLQKEILEHQITEATLVESEKNYRDFLESMPDWLHVIDRNFRFVLMNTAFLEVNQSLGLETNVIGKQLTEVFPFLPPQRLADYENVFQTGKIFIVEEEIHVNGSDFYTETRLIPVFKGNQVVQLITGIRDIGKKKEVELLKQKNAEQKELLIREIHHRVKNNLAIVISLIDIQVRENKNPDFKRLSNDIKLRIRSMSLIHEQLYKSDELDRIPFGNYLNTLAHTISTTYSGQKIKVNTRFDPTEIRIEKAMPLGLIVNEILTNAFKYAFPDQVEGEISIDLKNIDHEQGLAQLTIKDNGVGLPEKYILEGQSSLGMLMIRLLSKQIDAELTLSNHLGTTYTLVFKVISPVNKE